MLSKQKFGLFLGAALALFIILMPTTQELPIKAKYMGAIVVLMSIWWVTDAISMYATALLPIALFPLLEILPADKVCVNYGNNYVFMLIGGFFIGKAIESQNLHKRIALIIIRTIGTSKKRILIGIMFVTAFISMWLANVTAAIMMLPIAMSIISKEEEKTNSSSAFTAALLLGIAYSSTLGGLGTLVGTPTNLALAGTLEKLYPAAPSITFFTWLKVGLPILVILFPVFVVYLIWYFRIDGNLGNGKEINNEIKGLGNTSIGEKRVMGILLFAILGWAFREDLKFDNFLIPGWATLLGLGKNVHDSTVSILAAVFLFVVPGEDNKKLIEWKHANNISWGVALFLGSGFAIAAGFEATGLADWLGTKLTFLGNFPYLLLILLVCGFVIIFTEFNSNTATANILLPIVASVAVGTNMNPLLLMIPTAIASSIGFMMPAGTGPNAVVFNGDKITPSQMIKCGLWLNLISWGLITLIVYYLTIPWLGLGYTLPEWAIQTKNGG